MPVLKGTVLPQPKHELKGQVLDEYKVAGNHRLFTANGLRQWLQYTDKRAATNGQALNQLSPSRSRNKRRECHPTDRQRDCASAQWAKRGCAGVCNRCTRTFFANGLELDAQHAHSFLVPKSKLVQEPLVCSKRQLEHNSVAEMQRL